MKIAVDAMGGDFAPGVVVEGLSLALPHFTQCEFLLVGHQEKVAFYLEKYGLAGHPRIRQVHAQSVCEMSDPSTISLRGKRDSSITVCARLLKEKEADAMVTPGHTGATVAATKVLVRTLPGVDRAALAASLPTKVLGKRFILMDAGANVDCVPLNLAQFAVMGGIYAEYVLKMKSPRIGLLSVGGEDSKGCELTKEAFKIIEKMPINFVGNIEPDAAFAGEVDVLISDGFAGNVLLKTAEGLAKSTVEWLKRVITRNAVRTLGAIFAQNAFRELKAIGAADEVGGAPLMGLNGICIIGHGGSNPKSVYNAIRVAAECVEFGVTSHIVRSLEECGVTVEQQKAHQE
ncbi:MAG: phosphate acyltransferase PlsX [Victivallaceae bacterium]|nr:phosphate acyltransferase PlsX [Victivallaceae bacterium]